MDPSQYESEEGKHSTLRQSDGARREILRDLLVSHLDMECGDSARTSNIVHTRGYFLGRHEVQIVFVIYKCIFSLYEQTVVNFYLCF